VGLGFGLGGAGASLPHKLLELHSEYCPTPTNFNPSQLTTQWDNIKSDIDVWKWILLIFLLVPKL